MLIEILWQFGSCEEWTVERYMYIQTCIYMYIIHMTLYMYIYMYMHDACRTLGTHIQTHVYFSKWKFLVLKLPTTSQVNWELIRTSSGGHVHTVPHHPTLHFMPLD